MAKKRTTRTKQTRFVSEWDGISPAVKKAAKRYSQALDDRMRMQGEESEARTDLLELMHEHDLAKIPDPCHEEEGKVLERVTPAGKERLKRTLKDQDSE